MPTTYTHYAYGQEVQRLLPERIRRVLDYYEDYYNIGVHGPDILFYYRSYSKNKINQYGVQIHKEPMSVFLQHAFAVYENQECKEEAFAYLAGFMTHFILDSTCHPYIRRRIRETGICHAEIERDWDVLMMRRDHKDPLTFRSAGHVRPERRYGRVIAPYYKQKPIVIQSSLFYMRMILNHFFRSPFGITERLAAFTNDRFLKHLKYQHYFVKRTTNPNDKETCRELYHMYKDSRHLCAQMIVEMYDALNQDDRTFCEKERFERNFS